MQYDLSRTNVEEAKKRILELKKEGYYITMVSAPHTHGDIKMIATQSERSQRKLKPLQVYLSDLTLAVECDLLWYADEKIHGDVYGDPSGSTYSEGEINPYWEYNLVELYPYKECSVCGSELKYYRENVNVPTLWYCLKCDYHHTENPQKKCPHCSSELEYQAESLRMPAYWNCRKCHFYEEIEESDLGNNSVIKGGR